jgi:hypothetical protein
VIFHFASLGALVSMPQLSLLTRARRLADHNLVRSLRLVVDRRKKEVSGGSAGPGLEPSELFGQVVGYEGLAGCDSVDAAYLLNGLF